jgi:hypothetical protein
MRSFICAYEDVVPQKFYRHSGLRDHDFKVDNGRWYRDTSNSLGWPCAIYYSYRWHEVCLPFARFPNEVEALAILSPLDGEREREGRYIRVHAAYEAVVEEREVDFSAIRHLLAHPITRLTRPNVRESLLRRFGAMQLDLRNYHQQKEFYRCIGQMLISIDTTVHQNVLANWAQVIVKKMSNTYKDSPCQANKFHPGAGKGNQPTTFRKVNLRCPPVLLAESDWVSKWVADLCLHPTLIEAQGFGPNR